MPILPCQFRDFGPRVVSDSKKVMEGSPLNIPAILGSYGQASLIVCVHGVRVDIPSIDKEIHGSRIMPLLFLLSLMRAKKFIKPELVPLASGQESGVTLMGRVRINFVHGKVNYPNPVVLGGDQEQLFRLQERQTNKACDYLLNKQKKI